MNVREQQSILSPALSFRPAQNGFIQRKCTCGNKTIGGGECTECAKKKNRLQRKLAIGASNDPFEREADRVADQVIAMPASSTINLTAKIIQRTTNHPSDGIATAPASVDQVMASTGSPMPQDCRQDMEQRFGHDFSQVRIHTGTMAQQSAQEINAHAYTTGNNIVFGPGQFSPGTRVGKHLLAHELTHVIQQSGAERVRVNKKRENIVHSTSFPVSSKEQKPVSSLEEKKLTVTGLTPPHQLTQATPVIQRKPDKSDDASPSRHDEIALSKQSPGEFEIGTEFPPVISVFNFGINDHRLKKEHKDKLKILGEMFGLMKAANWQVFAVGHTDSTGEPELNDPLSAKRADAVRKYLNSVAKGNYSIRAEGENRPVATNESISGRTRNRRVDILFINPQIDSKIPDPIPDPKTVCQRYPFLCDEDKFCDRHPYLCGKGFCAKNPEWCLLPGLCLLFPPACACLAQPIICACGRYPALCACLANPEACIPTPEKESEPDDKPKRKKACPIKVDLPSGMIEADKTERVGFAELSYPFKMNIEFSQDSSGCECACGEYTQLVRGYFEEDKTGKGPWKRLPHELTKGVFLHETDFREDGLVGLGAYGHRYWDTALKMQTRPNTDGDKFFQTRETGCLYRGKDEPHLRSAKKYRARIRMYLDFAGGPADTCESPGQRLGQQAHWRTWIIYGEAQAKAPPPGPGSSPTKSPDPSSPEITKPEETDIAQGELTPSWYAGGIPSDATTGEYLMKIGFKVDGLTRFSAVNVRIKEARSDYITVVTLNKKNLNLNPKQKPDDQNSPVIVKPNHQERIERSILRRHEQ